MKSTKTLMCAMAVGTMIFAAGKVSAVPGVLTVSGTSLSETDSNPSSGIYAGKVTKYGFKTKDVLNLLAQGTEYWFGGNQGWFTNKASQLAYDPEAYNSDASGNYPYDIYGIFYVTNTSTHASYRLDGYDDGDSYYSFVEFDSYGFYELTGEDMGLGFWHDPGLGENYVESYKENDNKGTYSSKATLHGLLYIHDDPYYYDITDYPSSVFDNDKALIIRGLGTFNYNYNSTTQTESFTMSGSGDGYFSDSDDSYQVITGNVAFKSKGPNMPK